MTLLLITTHGVHHRHSIKSPDPVRLGGPVQECTRLMVLHQVQNTSKQLAIKVPVLVCEESKRVPKSCEKPKYTPRSPPPLWARYLILRADNNFYFREGSLYLTVILFRLVMLLHCTTHPRHTCTR